MQLSNFNEILFNEESTSARTWKKIKPVRFAIPVIIYKINVIKTTNVSNIFAETIVNLNKVGRNAIEIAEDMCIDVRMVKSVLEEGKSLLAEDGTSASKMEEEIQYIVYDCYNQCFFDSYIKSDQIHDKLRTDDVVINIGSGKISFVKSFGDSNKISAFILKSNKAITRPSDKSVTDYILSRKRDLYDRNTVYKHANQYDTHYAFLVCTYYVPDKDPTQRIVLDPIYGSNISNSVKHNFLNIVQNEEALNSEVKKVLDDMEEDIKSSSEATILDYGDRDKELHEIVRKKYTELEKNKYSPIERLLASLEGAIGPFLEDDFIGKNDSFKLESSKRLAVAIQDVIENIFALIVYRHADVDACRNAKKVDYKSYEHYLRNMGFEAKDQTMKTFIRKANSSIVKGIISRAKEFEQIRQSPIHCLIMASVLLSYGYNDDDTMYHLARTFPNLLELIEITGLERRKSKHDSDDARIFSVNEAKEGYLFVTKVVCVLLDINAQVTAEKVYVEHEKNDVGVLVNDVLKKYNIGNENIRRKAFDLVKAWFQRDDDFFGKCYNCLDEIFCEAMYSLLTSEIVEEILENMPEKLEDQLTELNGILEARGLDDRIKTRANKTKAQNVDEFKKTDISALMYIYIILADRHKPQLFEKTKKDFNGLFDLTEYVKEKRGHNNKTNFSDNSVNFEDIVNKILTYSTKLTENEDE